MGRNAQMISGPIAIRCRLDDPVNVAADQIEEFPGHHRDFTCIDAIRAEDRAAAALRALEEVIEPFLQDVLSEFPGSCKLSKNLS
jgi:hypothetical protein